MRAERAFVSRLVVLGHELIDPVRGLVEDVDGIRVSGDNREIRVAYVVPHVNAVEPESDVASVRLFFSGVGVGEPEIQPCVSRDAVFTPEEGAVDVLSFVAILELPFDAAPDNVGRGDGCPCQSGIAAHV